MTITEIEDENEWTWPDPCLFEDDNIIIEKTTEEIFEELENVVHDWKSKLEFVVAEGLKKIKRSTKEKKMNVIQDKELINKRRQKRKSIILS